MIRTLSTVIPARIFTLFTSEIILLYACFLAAVYTDPDLDDAGFFLLYDSGFLRIAIVVGFVILGLFLKNLYAEVRIGSRLALFQNLCIVFGLAFIGQGVLGYLNPNLIIPRKVMLPGTVLAGATLFGWRLFFDKAARTAVAAERVLFLGMSPTVAKIAGHFAGHPESGQMTIGYLESGLPAFSPSVPRLGTMADLDGILDRSIPDSIVIGEREDIRSWWTDEFLALRFGGVRVEEASTLYERIFARKCVTEIWPSKVIFAGTAQPSSIGINFQSPVSWLIAATAAVVTLPLTLSIAALIGIGSRGPLLTREPRVGLHDVPFEMYRFRCVRQDGYTYTPIGRLLRRYGLVWMPLLLNVLKGEMAIVGPRPERPVFAHQMNELIPFYRQRHLVKPGVTGWARIHRQKDGEQDSLRDLEYDLYYLENRSPLLDFSILLLSLKPMMSAGDSAA